MPEEKKSGRVHTVTLEDQGKSQGLRTFPRTAGGFSQCEYVMPLRHGSTPYQAGWRHGPPRRLLRDRDVELEIELKIGQPDSTRCPQPGTGWEGNRCFCRPHLRIEHAKVEKRAAAARKKKLR